MSHEQLNINNTHHVQSQLQKLTEDQLKAQIMELNRKIEGYKFMESYVQDLIAMWPSVTFRTIWKVTAKIADLKEALTLTK